MNFTAFILTFLIPLTLTACHFGNEVTEQKQAVVFTRHVRAGSISDLLNYPARIRAKINATVLSESDGIVKEVLVTLGKQVRNRQTLMVLIHTDPVYQYAPVRVQAPTEGIVSVLDVTPGTHVVHGQKLAAIINPAQIEILTEIPAQDLAVMKKEMVGEFRFPGLETPVRVKVVGISPFVDPTTGTALAQLDILSKLNQIFSPGVQGQVVFKANEHQEFLIPDSALIYKGKDSFIRVIENKKIRQIQVHLGGKQRGNVEILKGLSGGMELVERASRFVADGETVTIENLEAPSESH